MNYILTVVLLLAHTPFPTSPQNVRVHAGFMNGNEYLDMDTSQKRAYAMGVVNGMLNATLLGAPENKVAWFTECTKKMNDEQVAAILTKHLRDNPAVWHLPMNITSYNAMQKACPNAKRYAVKPDGH